MQFPRLLFLACWLIGCGTALAQDDHVALPVAGNSERQEIHFSQAPTLELELTKYLTSDVSKPRTFEIMATLTEALLADEGFVLLPAQTRLRLKAAVRPGSYFGHPGEIVLWLDPFLLGKNIEGFNCEASEPNRAKLLPLLCANTWRASFDHLLDYAQTPETGRPLVLSRKPHHEGITGTRASRQPNVFYDPAGGNVDIRVQTIASRFQAAGIVYELGAATAGVVRLLFSKRNVFLPSGTKVVFQLEHKLRLVPASAAAAQALPVSTEPLARARRVQSNSAANAPLEK